jgi:hypothetical protein
VTERTIHYIDVGDMDAETARVAIEEIKREIEERRWVDDLLARAGTIDPSIDL